MWITEDDIEYLLINDAPRHEYLIKELNIEELNRLKKRTLYYLNGLNEALKKLDARIKDEKTLQKLENLRIRYIESSIQTCNQYVPEEDIISGKSTLHFEQNFSKNLGYKNLAIYLQEIYKILKIERVMKRPNVSKIKTIFEHTKTYFSYFGMQTLNIEKLRNIFLEEGEADLYITASELDLGEEGPTIAIEGIPYYVTTMSSNFDGSIVKRTNIQVNNSNVIYNTAKSKEINGTPKRL